MLKLIFGTYLHHGIIYLVACISTLFSTLFLMLNENAIDAQIALVALAVGKHGRLKE